LELLRGKHPVVDWVLEHRELAKLKSTYVDALQVALNSETGCVHTSYSQIGAVTGRLSSSNPNLQNIPIRSEEGRRIRHGFVAGKKNFLLAVDYSQIELRIGAHMAQDEAMLEAFRAGQDIHTTTAMAIYGVPAEGVTKDMRRRAKGINFGLIYGMSVFGLTRYTDLTLAEAGTSSRPISSSSLASRDIWMASAGWLPSRDMWKPCWDAGATSPHCRAGRMLRSRTGRSARPSTPRSRARRQTS
jgi:DNA polymerase-1